MCANRFYALYIPILVFFLSGLRLLTGVGMTDMDEAEAFSYARDIIDIYSSSWGPSDIGSIISKPRTLTELAFQNGVTYVRKCTLFRVYYIYLVHSQGRGGKGSIYVWANGNGEEDDDCAADGYASSIYTISVGAIGVDGLKSPVDERCSSKFVVAYATNDTGHSAIVSVTISPSQINYD